MSARKKSKPTKRQTQQSKRKWGPILLAGIVIVGLIGLGYLLFQSLQGPAPIEPTGLWAGRWQARVNPGVQPHRALPAAAPGQFATGL